jgi:hypothetical protein
LPLGGAGDRQPEMATLGCVTTAWEPGAAGVLLPGREAVAYVRRHHDPRSVETPWQRRFVAGFR